MAKQYRIYQIDAFTKEKLKGNPAGVVTNADGLSEQQMQEIAREFNNSETAFILSPEDDSYDVGVRFFTPTSEVPICGHATIAAHYARALENHFENTTRVLQKTNAGILPVDIIRKDDDYKIVMTQGKIEVGEALSTEVQQMLTDPNFTLVDNRTWEEYIGQTSGYSYLDKAGRIDEILKDSTVFYKWLTGQSTTEEDTAA